MVPATTTIREDSHVPAALIRRFHEAKIAGSPTVTVWGTGQPRREFLAVDDLADACVFVMKHYSDLQFLNVGTGEDITIAEFARLSPTWSAFAARSNSTLRGPTARRRSFSMYRASMHWAGARKLL